MYNDYIYDDKKIISAKIQEWAEAVLIKDFTKIKSLYHKNAMVLPTFDNRLLKSREEIIEYIHMFANLKGLQINVESLHTRIYGDIAINNGLYKISCIRNGKFMEIAARYNFIYIFENNNWLIIDQHSSFIPERIVS